MDIRGGKQWPSWVTVVKKKDTLSVFQKSGHRLQGRKLLLVSEDEAKERHQEGAIVKEWVRILF